MTDQKWIQVCKLCQQKLIEHQKLLRIAENEYNTRFGNYPSDVDDDWWIDMLHYGNGTINLDSIVKSAKARNEK